MPRAVPCVPPGLRAAAGVEAGAPAARRRRRRGVQHRGRRVGRAAAAEAARGGSRGRRGAERALSPVLGGVAEGAAAPRRRLGRRRDCEVRRAEPHGPRVELPAPGAGLAVPDGVPDGVPGRGAGAHAGGLRDGAADAADEVPEERDLLRAGHARVRAARRLDVSLRGRRPGELEARARFGADLDGGPSEVLVQRLRRGEALARRRRARSSRVAGDREGGERQWPDRADVRPRLRRGPRGDHARDAAGPDALASEVPERRLHADAAAESRSRPCARGLGAALGPRVEHPARADRGRALAAGRGPWAHAQVVRPSGLRPDEPRGDHDAARGRR